VLNLQFSTGGAEWTQNAKL